MVRLTNDSRKGWRYKLRTDRNQRLRREPKIRATVEAFRRRTRDRAACASRSRAPHAGKLEVHHVGGIKRGARKQRLQWLCQAHNQADDGNRYRGRLHRDPPGPRVPWGFLLAAGALAAFLLAR